MGKALATDVAPPLDLEAEYNNRERVPGHPALLKRWREESARTIDQLKPETVKYGTGERERMDWFDAGANAPVAIFIHGGYWQALDRAWFGWIAPALLEHGLSVAIPSYDLAPGVRIGGAIGQMRRATDLVRERTGRRPLVFGHSAGGHMAACMLSEGRARATLAISGVFDLEPLVPTSLNIALGLDPAEARALSPIHWPAPNGSAPGGRELDCWVGAAESPEFIRQSREMAAAWGGRGVETRVQLVDGADHFTVLDPLADPKSAMVKRLAELASPM